MRKKTLCLHNEAGKLVQSRTVEDKYDNVAKHRTELLGIGGLFGGPHARLTECEGYGKAWCLCSSPEHVYNHAALKDAVGMARNLLNDCAVTTVRMMEGRITQEQFEGLALSLNQAQALIKKARANIPMRYIFDAASEDTSHMSLNEFNKTRGKKEL